MSAGTDSDLNGYDDTSPEMQKALRAAYKDSYAFREKIDVDGFDHPLKMYDLTEELTVKAVGEEKGDYRVKTVGGIPRNELRQIVFEVEKQMKEAAKNLDFERAAALRDELYELKNLLAEDESLKPWERIKLMTGEE